MIAPALVQQVRRLLAEGKWSQRKIARLTGVSRGTVGAIASGKRPDYKHPRCEDDEPQRPTGPPQRCPGCGGIVYMPCRLCRVRKQIARPSEARRRRTILDADPLELDLRPDHRRRYEAVRARRVRQGEPVVEDRPLVALESK